MHRQQQFIEPFRQVSPLTRVLFCSGEVCEWSSWGRPAGEKDKVREGEDSCRQQVAQSLAKLPGAAGHGECCRMRCLSRVFAVEVHFGSRKGGVLLLN